MCSKFFSVYLNMSVKTDINSLFEVYVMLQDVMKQHEIINSTLKDLFLQEDNQDFSSIENASVAIIEACNKIENEFTPKSNNIIDK